MASDDEASETPATIQIGMRTIAVDPTSLPGKPRPERYLYRRRDDERRYVLSPRTLDLFLILLLAIVPAIGAVVAALAAQEWKWLLIGTAFLAGAGSLFVFVMPAKVCLDFENRRLIISRRGLRRIWSLEQVVGVQLCSGGIHRIAVTSRGPRPSWSLPPDRGFWVREPDGSIVWTSFQINLIMDDDRHPRLNISHHGDRVWTRTIGAEIAERLKIMLLDQMKP